MDEWTSQGVSFFLSFFLSFVFCLKKKKVRKEKKRREKKRELPAVWRCCIYFLISLISLISWTAFA